MGKAVSNLYRFGQIAKSANTKYLNSLVLVEPPKQLTRQIEQISSKTTILNSKKNEQSFSAFNLLSEETCIILQAINDGRFALQAFSNRQLRELST
ncbi:MAG: hypothetical protein AAF960_15200 [Bacteroidota bacterium]